MVASIAAAMEKAKMKKSGKHHITNTGPIHGSFPQQGSAQPSYMGSQSAPPPGGGGMPMSMPQGMPSQGEDPGAFA